MKRILTLVIMILGLTNPSPIRADESFETAYEVIVTASENSKLKISQNISLTNKLAHVYATEYSLALSDLEAVNFSAYDAKGLLKTKITDEADQKKITVFFDHPSLGMGKVLNFQLNYEILNQIQKNGQIWEINVPGVANLNEIDNYQLQIRIPQIFGKPALLKPQPIEMKNEENYYLYRYGKGQIGQGIYASFGDFQIFDFKLVYHLINPNLTHQNQEIALPPDTAYQQVFYESLTPQPTKIRTDNDGNWLANFKLGSKERLNVVAQGYVKIFSSPLPDFPPTSTETLQKNLLAQKYWEVDDPLLVQKATRLKTVREIYQYVTSTLDYDFERVKEGATRMGAASAIANPQKSICMEFTDLFVTLGRAAGIPAREVNGFAYTTNSKLKPLSLVTDILHAWPEYWEEKAKIWRPVDPTWENTTNGADFFDKTDLNHFTFVIHGENSETPLPAGSYKIGNAESKDVEVSFGQFHEPEEERIKISLDASATLLPKIYSKAKLTIKNDSHFALYNLKPQIQKEGIEVIGEIGAISQLLPGSSVVFEIKIRPKTLSFSQKPFLKISLGNAEIFKDFKSFSWEIVLILGVGGLLVLLIATLTFFRKIW